LFSKWWGEGKGQLASSWPIMRFASAVAALQKGKRGKERGKHSDQLCCREKREGEGRRYVRTGTSWPGTVLAGEGKRKKKGCRLSLVAREKEAAVVRHRGGHSYDCDAREGRKKKKREEKKAVKKERKKKKITQRILLAYNLRREREKKGRGETRNLRERREGEKGGGTVSSIRYPLVFFWPV